MVGLAALSAGSAPAGEDNTLSFRGLSPLMDSITIDGADHNLAFSGRQRGSSGNGYSTTQAAINEFQVNTSNFSSEYGHAAGGIINSVTRSGTTRLHGQASFYDRDAAWGAGNPYTALTERNALGQYLSVPYKPADTRMQWSASAGGPISPRQALLVLRLRSASARLSRRCPRQPACDILCPTHLRSTGGPTTAIISWRNTTLCAAPRSTASPPRHQTHMASEASAPVTPTPTPSSPRGNTSSRPICLTARARPSHQWSRRKP